MKDRILGWLDSVQFAKTSRPIFAIALILAIFAVLTVWRDPQIVAAGYEDTQSGPLGPADRDMLYKVKQAGLWEMPVGEELTRSPEPAVREMGARISIEHMQLDKMVERTADELGVDLPTSPTPDQQSWMKDVADTPPGLEQDRKAAFYLRRAHGIVLPVLSQVKVGTRNSEIRQLATDASVFVSRHIGYLDQSGLINYSELPEPPTPSPYQQPAVASYWDSHDLRTMVVGAIVILVLGALLAAIVVPMIKARPAKVKPKTTSGKRRR